MVIVSGKNLPWSVMATAGIVGVALIAVIPSMALEDFGSGSEWRTPEWQSQEDAAWSDHAYGEYRQGTFRAAYENDTDVAQFYTAGDSIADFFDDEPAFRRGSEGNVFYTDDWYREEGAFENWYG
jgi:hypothetical protein